MLFRIIGAIAVISGCTGLGMYYALKEGHRVKELFEFKKALLILASEIEYMSTPLGTACENVSTRTSYFVSSLFNNFAKLLTNNQGDTTYRLWLLALETSKDASHLQLQDLEIIESFGKTLGYLDKTMQQNAIDYAINYINETTTELVASAANNKRMFQSLGVIGGLLITVVLW